MKVKNKYEENKNNKYIIRETTEMHNEVAAIYEALMDKEHVEAVKLLDSLGERIRNVKADLNTKED